MPEQSMDSQKYQRLEQSTAGGAKTQTEADDTFIGCTDQYAELTCSHYGKEGDSATLCKLSQYQSFTVILMY
jgi:hypothetical protein